MGNNRIGWNKKKNEFWNHANPSLEEQSEAKVVQNETLNFWLCWLFWVGCLVIAKPSSPLEYYTQRRKRQEGNGNETQWFCFLLWQQF